MQYTPAYYVLCAGAGKALGIAGDDARAIYLLSRSIALLFNVLTCWYVYRCGRLVGVPTWSALVAGITFCTFWEHFFTRMDAMAAAASFAAFHGFIRWTQAEQRSSLVACAVFGVLAFQSKQLAWWRWPHRRCTCSCIGGGNRSVSSLSQVRSPLCALIRFDLPCIGNSVGVLPEHGARSSASAGTRTSSCSTHLRTNTSSAGTF